VQKGPKISQTEIGMMTGYHNDVLLNRVVALHGAVRVCSTRCADGGGSVLVLNVVVQRRRGGEGCSEIDNQCQGG